MAFYDWINIGFPTFVPDQPLHTYTLKGTNHKGWKATLLTAPMLGSLESTCFHLFFHLFSTYFGLHLACSRALKDMESMEFSLFLGCEDRDRTLQVPRLERFRGPHLLVAHDRLQGWLGRLRNRLNTGLK